MSEIFKTGNIIFNTASGDTDSDLADINSDIDSGIVANKSDELYIAFRSQIGAMVLQGAVGNALSLKSTYDSVLTIIGSAIQNDKLIPYFQRLYLYDKTTFHHSIRVAIYSLILAIRFDLTYDEKQQIVIAALLHDIGKVKIAYEIIIKPAKLNDTEMDLIKKHTQFGYDILKDDKIFSEAILLAVKHHHERCDGKGYPSKLEDVDTTLFAKIISISDIYDALSSRRAYKCCAKLTYAVRYLESISGSALTADIVDNFITSIGIFPIGTTLLLDSNEVAVIFQNKADTSFMPTVKIITDNCYKLLDEPIIFNLNTKDSSGNYIKSINSIIKKNKLFELIQNN